MKAKTHSGAKKRMRPLSSGKVKRKKSRQTPSPDQRKSQNKTSSGKGHLRERRQHDSNEANASNLKGRKHAKS